MVDEGGVAPLVHPRDVFEGKVWPKDPHEFHGDENDILEEQLEGLTREQLVLTANAVLALLADPDIVIRSRAVIACRWLTDVVEPGEIIAAAGAHRDDLEVAPPSFLRQITEPTLWLELLDRVARPPRGSLPR